jgi:hypothetical protein
MEKLVIYRVFHDEKLLRRYPLPFDSIRKFYNTKYNPWGKYFNEFCVWFDESINIDSEFVGLEHYRRSFKKISKDNKNDYLNNLPNDGCYVYQRFYDKSNYPYLMRIGLEKFHNQICEFLKDNNYLKELEIAKTGIDIGNSMFIMKNEYFQSLRKFLIEIKDHILKVNNIVSPEDALNESKNIPKDICWGQPHRFMGYILEYMTDVWIRANLNNILFT